MKLSPCLAAATLAAALVLSGTGTTAAAWRGEAAVDAGTITAGALEVAVAAESSASARKYVYEARYTVSATVVGDNVAARLRIRFEEEPDAGVDEVMLAPFIQVGDATPVYANDGEVVVGVIPEGGSWPGGSDVEIFEGDSDGRISVPVTLIATQMDRAVARPFFAGGDLVTTLDQYRPGTVPEGASGLWRDEDSEEVPQIGAPSMDTDGNLLQRSSVRDSSVEVADEAVRPDDTDEPASPEREGTLKPEDESADEESPTDQVPAPEAERDVDTEDRPDFEPDAQPERDAEQASEAQPKADTELEATPEPAPEPDWAEELQDAIGEAGLDPDTIDPTELPAEIEEWATENEIPVDEIVAWLEGRTS